MVYLRPYPWMAVGTIGCAILSLLFAFTYPALTQFVIDEVIDPQSASALTPPAWLSGFMGWPEILEGADKRLALAPVMIGLLLAFLLRDGFNALRILVNNHFEQNVIFDMRSDVYNRLQSLPVGYFDQRSSGDLMTQVIEDVNSVERLLIDGAEQGSVAILSVIGVSVILFLTNPMLAAVAMVPIPILIGGAMWYTLTAHKRYRRQRRAASAMNALLMDNLQGIRQIKGFNRQRHEETRFGSRAEDLRQGNLGIMRAWAVYSPGMAFAAALGLGLVFWVGGSQVLAGVMTLGALVKFILYLNLFYDPIARLHGLNQMAQAARAAGERVFDILDATPERGSEVSENLQKQGFKFPTPVRGEVVYEEVQFQYDSDRKTLRDISLKAEAGEMIALVGPTGSGKSTLVNLLPTFYEIQSGRILIDGINIKEAPLEELREHISIVSQEPFLFNGTVRENIQYGRLDASEEEVFEAARAANCHDFITHLPDGYDSWVGERGVKLSVGEKQRVSIARALLKNSPILILDEATASVDTATEKLIQEALERLMKNRTSFVIAHRLSTIRNADKIIALKSGRIVEQGSHDELMANEGLYAKLAKIQNVTFIEEAFEKMETPTEA